MGFISSISQVFSRVFSHHLSVIPRVRCNWKCLSFSSSWHWCYPSSYRHESGCVRTGEWSAVYTLLSFPKMEVTFRFAWSYHKDNSCMPRNILTTLKSKKDSVSSRWSINTSCVHEEMINKRTNGWRVTGDPTFEKLIITDSLSSFFFFSLICFMFQPVSVVVRTREGKRGWGKVYLNSKVGESEDNTLGNSLIDKPPDLTCRLYSALPQTLLCFSPTCTCPNNQSRPCHTTTIMIFIGCLCLSLCSLRLLLSHRMGATHREMLPDFGC